ncbi:hypothetical protein RHGRI_012368 [Rhododendron griersonianum]|uniref:Late embryogenesis abundant protein LEA-2 subgroup domain-containing protein n=1 Tax=Rhododendron griersonianum TaxID=479676 RepID=A0AAV6KRK5_9ERIC|nr:hypothetical protein RHGRI_012368 [Rhododendron griersonianum]
MENRKVPGYPEPVMGYPAPAGFSRPSVIYNNAPLRAHPPAAAATITSAPNPSLAKPVEDAQLSPVGRGVKACCWVLLFFVLGVLVWVFVTESSPPEFKISSLSVSPINSSSSSILKANWNISLAVRNPSYFSRISYERVQVSVLYHGIPLSTALFAPFSQYQRGESFLEANMETLSSSSSSADNDLVSSIDRDLQDGAVNFTVAVDSTVSWNDNEEYRHRVTVSCDNMMVGQLAGNKAADALVGGSRKCKASYQ